MDHIEALDEFIRSTIPPSIVEKLPKELQSKLVIAVALAGGLLMLFTALLLRLLGGKSSGSSNNTVLIVGTCSAGKTAMWKKLEGGPQPAGYVTSMQENVSVAPIGGRDASSSSSRREVRFVDYPGHPRLRSRLPEFLDSASCLVFVIDSLEFPAQYQEVAELLMDILTHKSVQKRKLPLVIACNKQDDLAKAYSVDFIRKKLEKQLDSLQTTRTALAESGNKGKGGSTALLPGAKGETFTFAQWPGKVEVLATSVTAAEPGLDGVRQFLLKNI